MNEAVKQRCEKCGSEMALNPRTSKWFCSAKCWLGQQNLNQAIPQVKNKPRESSFYLSYAKDLCIAMLHEHAEHVRAGKAEPMEVTKLMDSAVEALKIAIKALE